MRRLMWLTFALLVLLAMGTLVEGPVQAESLPPPTMPETALAAPARPGMILAPALRMQTRGCVPASLPAAETAHPPAMRGAWDRNGRPLTAQSYTRGVYQAFPPERGFA